MRRFTIYLPEPLAEELRRRSGGHVSAFVAEVLQWEFAHLRVGEGLQRLEGLPADPDEAPLTDAESIIRAVQALRHSGADDQGPAERP